MGTDLMYYERSAHRMIWQEPEISDDPQFCHYSRDLLSTIPLGFWRDDLAISVGFGMQFCSPAN
jgi:hypothetical protein